MSISGLYKRLTTHLTAIFGQASFSSFHKMVAHTIFIQMGMMVITTIISIFLSRALGLEGRGVVSWMIAFSNFGSICVVLGLGAALKKYMIKMPENSSGLIASGLIAIIASLIFFLPIFYYYGSITQMAREHHTIFLYALLMIPLLAFSNLFNEILVGLGRGLHYNILYIIEKITNSSLNIALLIWGMVFPVAVMAVYMCAVILRLSAGVKFLRPHILHLPKLAELRSNYRIMRPLIVSSYFSNLTMFFANSWLTIALGLMSSSKELGYFAVAKTLTDAGLMFPSALATFILPQMEKEKECKRTRTVTHILIFAFALIFLIALPMFLFPQFIIHLLFGTAFMHAADCLPVLAIGMISAGIILVTNPIIASHHREHRLIINSSLLAICIAALTMLYRGSLDAILASYIYAFSYMLGMIISLFILYLNKLRPLPQQA